MSVGEFQPPRTWVLLGDKGGDNGQVETLLEALDWPVERRFLQPLPQWVYGKPRYRPTLDHLDPARSDALEPPWPELIITIGRRPSMAALWVRQQSGGRTRIVLVGKPSGHLEDFDLVIASAENQMPPLPNVLCTRLPYMRVDEAAVAAAAAAWAPRLAELPRPLVAFLVGGETNPFVMDAGVARRLLDTARQVLDSGGTPYITTSRRTTPAVLEVLERDLPAGALLYRWQPDTPPQDNPYRALLGSADGFVVTGDSISMQVEVARLRRPLAIFPLPSGHFGSLDLARRRLASWLNNPRCERTGDRVRQALARGVYRIDGFQLLSATRDFQAFHRGLIDAGLAVWAGEPLRPPSGELPDDLSEAVARVRALLDRGGSD
jgi:mitochondrial fission protein ELM1